MNINMAHQGMKVIFGRSNGEKTLGEIVRCNNKKANVRILVQRGSGRGSEVGTEWGVPYSMMEPANAQDISEAQSEEVVKVLPKLEYNMFAGVENLILEAINVIYGELSPENLSCDGELSATRIKEKRIVLQRQLMGLQLALGRNISEEQAWEWEKSKQAKRQSAGV